MRAGAVASSVARVSRQAQLLDGGFSGSVAGAPLFGTTTTAPGIVGAPLLVALVVLVVFAVLFERELALNEISVGERVRVQRSTPQE
jgi:hypothetical protein